LGFGALAMKRLREIVQNSKKASLDRQRAARCAL